MELDITHMMEDANVMPMLSGSILEHGRDADRITWRNSVAYGHAHPLLTCDSDREAARRYFAEFGAWSWEEIVAWSDDELNGILCQDIAGNIREMDVAEDYTDYRRLAEAGKVSGNIYQGSDGRWYFYMGH